MENYQKQSGRQFVNFKVTPELFLGLRKGNWKMNYRMRYKECYEGYYEIEADSKLEAEKKTDPCHCHG